MLGETKSSFSGGLLTPEERNTWNRDGYLHLRGVLPSEEIVELIHGIDQLSKSGELVLGVAGNDRDQKIVNAVSKTVAVDGLIDHPNLFGKILSLMGPYIQLAGSEIIVRQPHDDVLVRMHTDGGTSLRRIFPEPESLPLQLKVQYFLTDVSTPNSGNFVVVPGTHTMPFPEDGVDWNATASNSVTILAEPGDVVIFPWSVWHGVSPNRSGRVRKSVILRYSQMWCRPADYDKQEKDVLSRMTVRRRRLLGEFDQDSVPSDYYRPSSKHNHLEVVLGEEWRDRMEFQEYFNMYKLYKDIERLKWNR